MNEQSSSIDVEIWIVKNDLWVLILNHSYIYVFLVQISLEFSIYVFTRDIQLEHYEKCLLTVKKWLE